MVFIQFLEWISNLEWKFMRAICIGFGDENDDGCLIDDLPDECIIDVLSWLPSYDILTCRRVCKRWHTLTSSPLFIESQSKRAPTIILGQLANCSVSALFRLYFFIDDKNGKIKIIKDLKVLKITQFIFSKKNRLRCPQLLYSFGGLLLYKCCYTNFTCYVVLNPISRVLAVIPKPRDIDGHYFKFEVCGLFFHPSACEYNLLLARVLEDKISCLYYVYGSASNSWRNINTIPLLFRPPNMCDPVVVNMGLHWIVNVGGTSSTCTHAVMVFKIDSEEICSFPLPESVGSGDCDSFMMNLFEMDKQLCFTNIEHTRMNIWVLNDYKNWRWIKRSIVLSFSIPDAPCSIYQFTQRCRILYVHRDMFLVCLRSSRIFLIDLSQNAMSRIHDRVHDAGILFDSKRFYIFSSYTCSLKIPTV